MEGKSGSNEEGRSCYDAPAWMERTGRCLAAFLAGFATMGLVLLASWLSGIVPMAESIEKARCDYICAPDIPMTLATDYFRDHGLGEHGQALYDKMEGALRSMAEGVVPENGTTVREAIDAYHAVLADNPDIFWAESDISYMTNPSGVYLIRFKYSCSPDKAHELAEKHQQDAENVISQISLYKGALSSEKWTVELFHDWITANTEYVDTDHDQTIEGVFDDGRAVCAGYSRTMKYLCDEMGIACLYVQGHIYGDPTLPHAWNMLIADSSLWYVDATWDDMGTEDASVSGYDWTTQDASKFDKSHWTGYTDPAGILDEFAASGEQSGQNQAGALS